MATIGVDLGLKGGMAWIQKGELPRAVHMPVIDSEYDLHEIIGWIERYRSKEMDTLALVEKALLHPKSGKKSWQRMGQAEGIFQGILHTLSIPYTFIHPRTWQKKMHRGIKAGTAKKKSEVMAKRYGFSTDHDGIMEALLIAQFGEEGGV